MREFNPEDEDIGMDHLRKKNCQKVSTDSTARKVIPILTILRLLLDCIKIPLFGCEKQYTLFFSD